MRTDGRKKCARRWWASPWATGEIEEPGEEEVRLEIQGRGERVQEVPQAEERVTTRRRFRIRHEDVSEHGATMGCLGCRSAVRRGAPARGHTEECRRRFEEIFTRTGDARVRRMVERISEEVREAVEGNTGARRE